MLLTDVSRRDVGAPVRDVDRITAQTMGSSLRSGGVTCGAALFR